ncbi:hypothetical protein Q4566_10145 [Tamlana sp. 2_MG-2023]|uniref:hypothetical protein n=1 Tax=unclassified Tamlana TaxID=2614803 RepID=UPI0026E332B7|nr:MULTISPECIES: hypothetical protein [unclassified Tamlana]MDO6760559.1 hypothetical protein [Tamlana sp. 2_MG-2023]MDO6790815.1 hypothetical protein [Tamlana sp. 1_MG-2023]
MITCLSLFMLFTACGKDDVEDALGISGCSGVDWEDDYEDALSDFGKASSDFSENPSPESCNEYKAATLRYYDAIEDIYDCIPDYGYDYEETLREIKKDLDEIDCSDYN